MEFFATVRYSRIDKWVDKQVLLTDEQLNRLINGFICKKPDVVTNKWLGYAKSQCTQLGNGRECLYIEAERIK